MAGGRVVLVLSSNGFSTVLAGALSEMNYYCMDMTGAGSGRRTAGLRHSLHWFGPELYIVHKPTTSIPPVSGETARMVNNSKNNNNKRAYY
eukprot:scaffold6381_cov99-Cylindrotheca_fusiformis.AAC.2